MTRATLAIVGMHCASCVSKVEKSLQSVHGVASATVNLSEERAAVDMVPPAHITDLIAAVEKVGYKAAEFTSPAEQEASRRKALQSITEKFWVGISISVVLMVLSMHQVIPYFRWLSPVIASLPENTVRWISLILATPIYFWVGWDFHAGAWQQIKHRSTDMNTLIAVGTGAAYYYSAALTIFALPGDVYFETAAVIISLILLGRVLEARAKSRARDAMKKLAELQVKNAHVWRNGREIQIPIGEVAVSDAVIVRPGERIPTDGKILRGNSSINEAMVTGESVPVDKKPGDNVIGGTMNTTGSFVYQVTHVGADTVLSQIARLVENAQNTKPPIQKLADQVAGVFVPIVIAIAVLSAAIWYFIGPEPRIPFALTILVSVLIVACPCALGLATPTAIVTGTGRGAHEGILIRNADVLEQVREAEVIVFDKTGTITKGEPAIVSQKILNRKAASSERLLLYYAASLEFGSEHPLALAVVREAKKQKVELKEPANFESLTGFGVKGIVNRHNVIVGNPLLFEKEGIPLTPFAKDIQSVTQNGETPVIVALDGEIVGLFGILDPPKPEADKVLEKLKRLGLRLVLLTGDQDAPAKIIAKKLGFDEYYSELRPEQKIEKIKEIQQMDNRVAMVGDGINDAPALAQADLGIAMGAGSDVAREASDITLLGGDLRGVVRAIHLSRATLWTIYQNLFWAFIYNVIAIPVAAGILYPTQGFLLSPMIAAAAMAASSVSVVLNSLRLKYARID